MTGACDWCGLAGYALREIAVPPVYGRRDDVVKLCPRCEQTAYWLGAEQPWDGRERRRHLAALLRG